MKTNKVMFAALLGAVAVGSAMLATDANANYANGCSASAGPDCIGSATGYAKRSTWTPWGNNFASFASNEMSGPSLATTAQNYGDAMANVQLSGVAGVIQRVSFPGNINSGGISVPPPPTSIKNIAIGAVTIGTSAVLQNNGAMDMTTLMNSVRLAGGTAYQALLSAMQYSVNTVWP